MKKGFVLAAAAAASFTVVASELAAAPTWTQLYDQTSTTTRSLRGLALSDDGATIYGGYVQGSSTAGFARYTLAGSPPVGTPAGFHDVNAVAPVTTDRDAEAVTTDDRGIVYGGVIKDSTSGVNSRVTLLSSTLATTKHFDLPDITGAPGNIINGETIGGLDLRKSGSVYQLYVARFRSDTAYIERYVVGGTDVPSATLTLDPTFDGDGTFNLRAVIGTADNLRGIDVAADGTIFVASREDNVVYRVPSTLTGITSTPLTRAMDVAVFGSNLYVTQYNGTASAIVELAQSNLLPTGNVFTATGPFAARTNNTEGYSGIDIDASGRMYLNDQFYAGTQATMQDRILVSSPIPEPAALATLTLAPLALVRRRRQKSPRHV